MKTFFEALQHQIPEIHLATKGNLSYISAAVAQRLAGRPKAEFVDFEGKPYLECLGGALVAVDLTLPNEAGLSNITQRMWLPVMDQDNQALAVDQINLMDINNNRQRCLVKAIAAVYGDGMSLYMGCGGDGPKAVHLLGITPETELAEATPVVATLSTNSQEKPYIEWGIGLSVCRITDPTFHWKIELWNGLPYRQVLGGVMVDVTTTYRGKSQTLSMPVLDSAFVALPIEAVTTFHWNKAVMRALTKCIAFNTGYGLAVYADEVDLSASTTRKHNRKPVKIVDSPNVGQTKSTVQNETQGGIATKAVVTTEMPKSDFQTRFRNVMLKRKEAHGVMGLISLFDALAQSDKFTAEEKPVCYATLVSAITAVVTVAEVGATVAAIAKHNAMTYVVDSRELVAAKLTAILIAATVAEGDESLAETPKLLIEAGIVKDIDDALRLAKVGNVAVEVLDLLKDLVSTS